MPYSSLQDLPEGVKKHLPKHGQEIYKEAFNHAWQEYKAAASRRDDDSRETVAHKVAWAAVKHQYKKGEDGHWHKK